MKKAFPVQKRTATGRTDRQKDRQTELCIDYTGINQSNWAKILFLGKLSIAYWLTMGFLSRECSKMTSPEGEGTEVSQIGNFWRKKVIRDGARVGDKLTFFSCSSENRYSTYFAFVISPYSSTNVMIYDIKSIC